MFLSCLSSPGKCLAIVRDWSCVAFEWPCLAIVRDVVLPLHVTTLHGREEPLAKLGIFFPIEDMQLLAINKIIGLAIVCRADGGTDTDRTRRRLADTTRRRLAAARHNGDGAGKND